MKRTPLALDLRPRVTTPTPVPSTAPVRAAAKERPASRREKRQVGVWFPDAYHRRLKMLAARIGRTVQELGEEAFEDLLAKHGEG